MYPDVSEGELTRFKAVLVSEQGLLETAKKLDLGRYLLLGRGEDRSGGRRKSSVLANAMEALIAAIYLDGGFDPAFRVVADLYKLGLVEVGQAERRVDFKTKLQEVVQERHQELPVYRVAGFSGPDHDRVYETILLVQGRELARGMGRSKKESEQVAARQAYETMTSVSESADDSD
jgi:dsRNA-specific ribonuclease